MTCDSLHGPKPKASATTLLAGPGMRTTTPTGSRGKDNRSARYFTLSYKAVQPLRPLSFRNIGYISIYMYEDLGGWRNDKTAFEGWKNIRMATSLCSCLQACAIGPERRHEPRSIQVEVDQWPKEMMVPKDLTEGLYTSVCSRKVLMLTDCSTSRDAVRQAWWKRVWRSKRRDKRKKQFIAASKAVMNTESALWIAWRRWIRT